MDRIKSKMIRKFSNNVFYNYLDCSFQEVVCACVCVCVCMCKFSSLFSLSLVTKNLILIKLNFKF